MPLAWCEIDQSALRSNFAALAALCGPETQLAPVVKANAYGHGMTEVARVLTEAGARWLSVQELDEALALRAAGLTATILLLGPVDPSETDLVARHGFHVTAYRPDMVAAFAAAGRAHGVEVPVHLKVETGINRQGVFPAELAALARAVHDLAGVRLAGVSTHFADGDDIGADSYMRVQLRRFEEGLDNLRAAGIERPLCHCANTTSFLLWPAVRFDLARVGIAVYGLWPSVATERTHALRDGASVQLRPVLSWKTRLVQVRPTPAGEPVGYGCTETLTRPSLLGVIPVGYYDGYVRALTSRAYVLVRGCRAPVRGVVMMNMTVVDLTDVPGAAPGDEVVLIGRQGADGVSADQHARWTGTIHYEVTTRIRPTLPRIVV